MTPESAEFKAIEELTRQTDYTSLCQCALRSLRALAPDSEVELYEAYDTRGHTPWEVTELEHLVLRRFPRPAVIEDPPWLDSIFRQSKKWRGVRILD
jgi:hypothetical protein